MRAYILIATLFLFVASLSFGLVKLNPIEKNIENKSQVKRIISLTPSVTEMLYLFGRFNDVVAVTRYCTYPPEANDKPKVGGIFDINMEQIVGIKPDLIIITEMQKELAPRLRGFGLEVLILDHSTLKGVIESFEIVGRYIGSENALKMKEELEKEIEDIKEKSVNLEQKKIVFSLFRDVGSGNITNLSVVGNDGFYSEIIKVLNLDNPFVKFAAYPSISKEGLFDINPDVIIELVYDESYKEQAIREWQTLPMLKAVQNNKICIISESYGYTPGPRFNLLMRDIARCVYSEEPQ